jgi:hypothetical protein
MQDRTHQQYNFKMNIFYFKKNKLHLYKKNIDELE